MVESFYAALGVDRDADAAAIDRAYRDRVKTHHPDVSDSPDADERFRRLTTARDVLVDEDERARYDDLGHGAYLRSEGGRSGWPVPESGAGDEDVGSTAAAAARATVARTAASDGGQTDTATDSPRSESSSAVGSSSGSAAGAAGSGAGGTGAAYHRPGERLRPDAAGSSMPGPVDVLRAVGPWAVVDLVLLSSALATAWMIMTVWSLSLGSILLATFLLAVAFCATVFHLSVKVAG